VLDHTRADAIMIGRAAQGRPWIFREIRHFLDHGKRAHPPALRDIRMVLTRHLDDLYGIYGENLGVRIARKHVGWYTRTLAGAEGFRARFNALETAAAQLAGIDDFLARLADRSAWRRLRRSWRGSTIFSPASPTVAHSQAPWKLWRHNE